MLLHKHTQATLAANAASALGGGLNRQPGDGRPGAVGGVGVGGRGGHVRGDRRPGPRRAGGGRGQAAGQAPAGGRQQRCR